jgi:hypothetical protein
MGSRDTLPEKIACEASFDAGEGAAMACGEDATPILSAVTAQTIVRGNSDFLVREKERLTKRAEEYDKSHKGKQAKMDAVQRRVKAGEIV